MSSSTYYCGGILLSGIWFSNEAGVGLLDGTWMRLLRRWELGAVEF